MSNTNVFATQDGRRTDKHDSVRRSTCYPYGSKILSKSASPFVAWECSFYQTYCAQPPSPKSHLLASVKRVYHDDNDANDDDDHNDDDDDDNSKGNDDDDDNNSNTNDNNTDNDNNNCNDDDDSRPWMPDVDYKSGNVAPKRKSDGTGAEKANKLSEHADLKGKWHIRSVTFLCPFSTSLLPLDQTYSTHWCVLEKTYAYKKEGEGC